MSIIDSQRIRILKGGIFFGRAVLYWMNRDKRVDDNWALLYAQEVALKNKVPLIVCFQYLGNFQESNIRQYAFLFKGLIELKLKLESLNMECLFLQGNVDEIIPKLISARSIGTVIVDYNPIKIFKTRIEKVKNKVSIPLFQVDSHNIIPVWITSNKKEYAAHTIRRKINSKIDYFLTDFPNIKKHPFGNLQGKKQSYSKIIDSLNIDFSVREVDWLQPGEEAAKKKLDILSNLLNGYDEKRNDPTKEGLSNLSPYFHFGHISPQRVAYEIKNSRLCKEDKYSFLEEMIVRKELADNFCEYESNYDYFEGFHPWAQKTLNNHRKDKREYLYPSNQFEEAETHDPLWNAAQNQMRMRGKMHGYMRMYWAKKILEWSPSPEIALQTAINLNDKYELDGRDPKGYTGIAWSIGGIHDRAWFERPVYGKIRYMNYNGCKSKFDVNKYIEMYVK
ncbi:MAG: deoxyribodipyrimidine photo-lyase [Candidatus Neomarinimicrobiota bacterium]